MSRGALYAFGLSHRDGWANPSLMSGLLPLDRNSTGTASRHSPVGGDDRDRDPQRRTSMPTTPAGWV